MMTYSNPFVAFIGLILSLLYIPRSTAQDSTSIESDHPTTSHHKLYTTQTANLLGIGGTILHDDYLSPLSYGGVELSYLYDKISRLTRDARWIQHYQGAVSIGTATNPAGNASYFSIIGDASYAAQCKTVDYHNLRLYIGPALRLASGGIYSTRNGNNPATLKLHLDLMAQLTLAYRLRCYAFPALFRLDWQGSLLGTAFAPGYGESYYELFVLKNHIQEAIKVTHPANAFSQRLLLTADLPLWNIATIRLGYAFRSLESRLNEIHTSWHSHSLMIGLAFEIKTFSGREAVNNPTVSPIL